MIDLKRLKNQVKDKKQALLSSSSRVLAEREYRNYREKVVQAIVHDAIRNRDGVASYVMCKKRSLAQDAYILDALEREDKPLIIMEETGAGISPRKLKPTILDMLTEIGLHCEVVAEPHTHPLKVRSARFSILPFKELGK